MGRTLPPPSPPVLCGWADAIFIFSTNTISISRELLALTAPSSTDSLTRDVMETSTGLCFTGEILRKMEMTWLADWLTACSQPCVVITGTGKSSEILWSRGNLVSWHEDIASILTGVHSSLCHWLRCCLGRVWVTTGRQVGTSHLSRPSTWPLHYADYREIQHNQKSLRSGKKTKRNHHHH